MQKNIQITLSIPHDLKDWIDKREPLPNYRSRAIVECLERVRAEEEALHAQVKMSDMIDALGVMVAAWEMPVTQEARREIGLGPNVVFPAVRGRIKSVDDAIGLFKRITEPKGGKNADSRTN